MIAGLRLVGYTSLRHCEFTDRLLQRCSCWCTKGSHQQATACVEHAARVVTGTRKFNSGLGQILHDELNWLDVPDRVFFKLAVIVHRCLNGRVRLYLSDYCVFRPPVLTLGDSCIPATVNFLQYHVTGSILVVAGPLQWPAPQSGTLSRILSGTQPSVQSVSDVCLRRTCLLDTSALSALEVL